MEKKEKITGGRHEHPLRHEIPESSKRKASNAHQQAEKDMEDDAEFSSTHPNDDLDEGESARLGEQTDLI